MAVSTPPAALIGWPLLSVPESEGRLTYPTLEQSVRQSIRIILSTRPGEQLMRPSFGAGLVNLLHEPNTLATRKRIHDLVVDSLAHWEQRIIVDRVEVDEVSDHPDQVRVTLAYRLQRSGAAQQMGLTVQLEA